MLFSSISFLYYFLPVVIILYFIAPTKIKNLILLLVSLIFYFCGEPIYVFLMLGTILVAYIHALLIDKYRGTKLSKVFLVSSIVITVSLLGFFKYTDFFIENINTVLGTSVALLKIALPIGISFYTFQILSYVIDVYKGNAKVQKSFLNLATYVSLFPQLIAGPIVRYTSVEDDLENRKHTFQGFAEGATRFVIGLAKKILIANVLGELCQDFRLCEDKTVLFYWLYAVAFSLHIYFDFSAYSDMAIGIGRMLGFKFPENFNYPYISKSITEFWRRWHMSLSTWFRDYIYIPLGGNRVGKFKLYRNILIVWLLTGFWHGAAWNFIVWGLFFAVFLMIEKAFLGKILEKLPSIISRTYLLFLIVISFVIFNADGMTQAIQDIGGMFGANGVALFNDLSIYYLQSYLVIFIIAIIGATPFVKNLVLKLKENQSARKVINILEPVVIVLLLVICTAYLVDGSFNPFLYFRF